MNNLIRAVEAWKPDGESYLLEFGGGWYGTATEFETVSRSLVFGRGEGLPGRVWEEGQAILLDSLEGNGFRRSRVAKKAGFEAAVAIPFHTEERLDVVVVLFFGNADGVGEGEPPAVDLSAGVANDASFESAERLVLPCPSRDRSSQMVTLHGTPAVPIACRIERWTEDMTSLSDGVGEAFASGLPQIVPADDASGTIAWPIVRDGVVIEVVTLSL